MATQQYQIISAEDSDLHGEPHVEGSRSTVRDIFMRVEQRGLDPDGVATRYSLDLADVYEALAYYYNNPEEMKRIAERHQRVVKEARGRSPISPPEN